MLRVPVQCAEKEKNEVSFRELPSWVLARVWECSLTWSVLEWKFPVVPEIALELLMTENFPNYYIKIIMKY